MKDMAEDKHVKQICAGLLAHVDAGKTTLSEGLLYTGGMIRNLGRVDKQDAFLDTNAMERERGITIFSKQAVLTFDGMTVTLLDTPGHVDFSAEMERTLQVLDYAILVISGADGIQGHTRTLWHLLEKYQIPVFLFINKMDQPGTDAAHCLFELKQQLSDNCIAFTDTDSRAFYEEAAMCDEAALEQFLESETIALDTMQCMIKERKIFPCYFGSALKLTGVEEFLHGFSAFTAEKEYGKEFGARVFKIARDADGNRLTYLKVTGGSLSVKDLLSNANTEQLGEREIWEEKVNQIRIYSGEKYETVPMVSAGTICAVTGLSKTYAGEGLGSEQTETEQILEPVLTYRMILPEECNAVQMLLKLRQLEEEDPMLHLVWNEVHQEILLQVMGEVQTEVLKRQIYDRFGVEVAFDTGHILYKETIADTVEGVGHFEPLRHYAEVHLLLEPGERGSGVVCTTNCSEDVLDKNWQRLSLTHLEEKQHLGVLTGAAVTDIKITLAAGRAHQKHTEGGDFRQATYRAVRQGLMRAHSVLLEPYYEYRLEVPESAIGKAMTDLELMHAAMEGPFIQEGKAVLTGKAPVAVLSEYVKEVTAYTAGEGKLFLSYGGYDVCHNPNEVIEAAAYDPEADLLNPTGSVFCAHGAGFIVEWDKVPEYMHVEGILKKSGTEKQTDQIRYPVSSHREEEFLAVEEVDAILAKTFDANKRDKSIPKKGYKTSKRIVSARAEDMVYRPAKKEDRKDAYLLVDGYNIIHAWKELEELSKVNMDGARGRLLDILCDYQGMKKCELIAVFDAYRVARHKTEILDYHNIHVVYTKEAETADAYIEKFAHEHGRKYHVTVATSDGLEQIIIRGAGCQLLSAQEFAEEICIVKEQMKEQHMTDTPTGRKYLLDDISKEVAEQLKNIE